LGACPGQLVKTVPAQDFASVLEIHESRIFGAAVRTDLETGGRSGLFRKLNACCHGESPFALKKSCLWRF